MGLQHFFDNELGGSLHGVSGAGLTEFGKAAVDRAVEKGMIIDLAHSSEATARDVLARSSKPVIVSHTGLKGHCDTARNISDDLMKAIAAHGGLIGAGFWREAACATSPEGIAEQIVYAVNLLGAGHVALGSDFDGTVTTALDASELAALTEALMDAGLDGSVGSPMPGSFEMSSQLTMEDNGSLATILDRYLLEIGEEAAPRIAAGEDNGSATGGADAGAGTGGATDPLGYLDTRLDDDLENGGFSAV